MKTSNTENKPVVKQLNEDEVEVESIYTGQKPQFQQSANKPEKTLSDHPKHSIIWE